MNIYFSASTRNIKKDVEIYRRILNTIYHQGHVTICDWVETVWLREMKSKKSADWLDDNVDWGLVKDAEAALHSAELVIAEVSDSSTFGVGYEVSLALQYRKPVLLLVNKKVAERSYATGLRNDLITYKKYDNTNLERIVDAFIKDNTLKKKDLRFNFVIDRQIHNHLRLRSFETGKTKAEIIRDLLTKDMSD